MISLSNIWWVTDCSNLPNAGNGEVCVEGLHKVRRTVWSHEPCDMFVALFSFFQGTASHVVMHSHCAGWIATCLCSVARPHAHITAIWLQLVNRSWCLCHTQWESFTEPKIIWWNVMATGIEMWGLRGWAAAMDCRYRQVRQKIRQVQAVTKSNGSRLKINRVYVTRII